MKFCNVVKSVAVLGFVFLLTACQGGVDGLGLNRKAEAPIPRKLVNKMKAYGMRPISPIMIRIFKEENVLEVWKQKDTKRYALLESYEICKWSGKYGPKFKEGDRQAPEGFYTVNKHQLNPRSQYHLSFNMGYPNAYDRAHGRTGSHLMIHGACSSAGCYSMTDDRVEEIYAMARDALRGGQKTFQIQAYPFRLTPENMVKHRKDKHYNFWTMLKQGYDHFELTRVPPKVNVCNRGYVFNTQSSRAYQSTAACPPMGVPQSLALAYTKRQNQHALKFEKLLARAEGRNVQSLVALTPSEALPGISVIVPKPPEPKVEPKVDAVVGTKAGTPPAQTAPANPAIAPTPEAKPAPTAEAPTDPFAAEASTKPVPAQPELKKPSLPQG